MHGLVPFGELGRVHHLAFFVGPFGVEPDTDLHARIRRPVFQVFRVAFPRRTCLTRRRIINLEPAVHVLIPSDTRVPATVRTDHPLIHRERFSEQTVSLSPRPARLDPQEFERADPPLQSSLQRQQNVSMTRFSENAP